MSPQDHFAWQDLFVVCLYFAGIVYLGMRYAARTQTTEQYFLAGRRIPGWAIALSMIGTSISSVTFLAIPANAFAENWSKLLPNLTLPLVAVLAVYIFMPFYRRLGVTTAYEFLGLRFGRGIRSYGSIVFILGQIARLGTILYLVSLPLHLITGYPLTVIIFVMGVLVVTYTVLGGIEAVIWTDVIQTIILLAGGLLSIGLIFYKLASHPDGVGQFIAISEHFRKFSFATPGLSESGKWKISLTELTLLALFLNGFFNNLYYYSVDQNVVQRYCAIGDDRSARRTVWLGSLLCVPTWVLFTFLGTCLFVFYQTFPSAMVEGFVTGHMVDNVYPYFILTELPVGLSGLVLAAVIAAAMSSLDSSLNAVATVSVVDFYRSYFAKHRPDAHYLRVAKFLTALAGVAMVTFALFLTKITHETMVTTGLIVGSIAAGGLAGLYMLGFFVPRANSRGVAIGLAVAVAAIAWMALAQIDAVQHMLSAVWLPYLLEKNWILRQIGLGLQVLSRVHSIVIGAVGNILLFCVGWAASLFFRSRGKPAVPTVWDRIGLG